MSGIQILKTEQENAFLCPLWAALHKMNREQKLELIHVHKHMSSYLKYY